MQICGRWRIFPLARPLLFFGIICLLLLLLRRRSVVQEGRLEQGQELGLAQRQRLVALKEVDGQVVGADGGDLPDQTERGRRCGQALSSMCRAKASWKLLAAMYAPCVANAYTDKADVVMTKKSRGMDSVASCKFLVPSTLADRPWFYRSNDSLSNVRSR